MAQAKDSEHAFQTAAKQREQRILAGPPPTGIGRRCKICKENLWHKEFYDHMNKHLDLMNDTSNEFNEEELFAELEA